MQQWTPITTKKNSPYSREIVFNFRKCFFTCLCQTNLFVTIIIKYDSRSYLPKYLRWISFWMENNKENPLHLPRCHFSNSFKMASKNKLIFDEFVVSTELTMYGGTVSFQFIIERNKIQLGSRRKWRFCLYLKPKRQLKFYPSKRQCVSKQT